jgi:hypothetical protein
MERKMKGDTLGRERRRDLRARLQEVKGSAWRAVDPPADPPNVAAARKLVARHDRLQRAASARVRDAILLAAKVAQRKLLETDSYDEGLRVVAKLEATAKRRGWIRGTKEA